MSDALQRLLARDNDNNTDSSVTSNEVKTEPVNNTDDEEAEDLTIFWMILQSSIDIAA